ncbi:amidohydrolase family protein [Streptomyces boluensis]|uniref:Amidohydrolase family protein n=1 Tax=Streptomyces boluensis TaxID=1775135 RepID=A0A964XNK7_9ACTN|nr:amidohydrolase family protein [Streptomyces boluensis]NBE55585.1 amidohydrolase family protein [Streptomyces boluensis]
MTALLLRNARVEDAPDPTDVWIRDGRIEAVGRPALDHPDQPEGPGCHPGHPERPYGHEELDCAGRVLLPGLIESHLHPDKALLDLAHPHAGGTLADAIRVTAELKAGFTHADVRARAEQVLRMCVTHGTTTVRAHPDVDPVARLTGLEVLLELRDSWAELVTLQIVAFPQEGILKAPGTAELLRRALAAGADAVGGCTYGEHSLADCRRHVEHVLDLAVEYGVPADLHADFADDASDPRFALAEFIAEQTVARGLSGRVTLGHATSLGGRPPSERRAALKALAEAGVAVVPLPATDLFLGGRGDTTAVRRGLAPVREMWDAGVRTACSSNNIRNAFTPYGTGDLLDTALLLARLGHLAGPADLRRVLRMVTYDAARVVGLPEADYGTHVGAVADLVLLDTQDYDAVLIDRPARTAVVKSGRIVARSTRTTELTALPAVGVEAQ